MALLLPTSNSSPILNPLLLQTQNQFPIKFGRSGRSIQACAMKIRRKSRPSFFEQIREKWSMKVPSSREKFPWEEHKNQHQQEQLEEEAKIETRETSGVVLSEGENVACPSASNDSVSCTIPNRFSTAPWVHRAIPKRTHLKSQPKNGESVNGFLDEVKEEDNVLHRVTDNVENTEKEVYYDHKFKGRIVNFNAVSVELQEDNVIAKAKEEDNVVHVIDNIERSGNEVDYNREFRKKEKKFNAVSIGITGDEVIARAKDSKGAMSLDERENLPDSQDDDDDSSSELPWEGEREVQASDGGWRRRRTSTELAERILPEHELKRLRNIALRMFERIKVGAAGINQDLLDAIHEKWKLDEVVKLKFKEPLCCNMKRTHEMLERRTGGLVIWRSGSSVVLYRGTGYNFQCVKSYSEQDEGGKDILSQSEKVTINDMHNVGVADFNGTTESFIPDFANYLKDLSQEELTEFSELNQLLDELGPRFKDWCGREPLPVDADLLPAVDPEYKAPFRLLPYGARHCLTNKEMTAFRRLARRTPPHFALGRNRELQGLAKAMVRLWEKSAVAKIAIKRGVMNTRNERMAEELRVLTGGTLLSRNKEYIVFYRGNDFLPPAIMATLRDRRKLTYLKHDEEEKARNSTLAFVKSNSKTSNGLSVAGTLAETIAATFHWRNQPDRKDVEEMLRKAALAKRAALLKHLQNKLALAKWKLNKAEKTLAKVQKDLDPSELPTDLEIITDEERVLYRKIGLSMKPYLLLGRRGVYDGTIQNMHLHWKYRELVKVIVKGKSLQQVKHTAISLEAESGGVLVSKDRTTKGYAVILYRGKNYQRPLVIKPQNLLTKRKALSRSMELQRREGLKRHISDLQERVELVKSELEEFQSAKNINVHELSSSTFSDAPASESDVKELCTWGNISVNIQEISVLLHDSGRGRRS